MKLVLANWGPNSVPYKVAGITSTPEAQEATLENTYSLIATPVPFVDPLGNASAFGVYMTDLQITIPDWSTPEQTFILASIQLTNATQVVA